MEQKWRIVLRHCFVPYRLLSAQLDMLNSLFDERVHLSDTGHFMVQPWSKCKPGAVHVQWADQLSISPSACLLIIFQR